MLVDAAEVTRLLGLSKAAHLAYQAEQRKPSADYAACERSVAEAQAKRMAAHELDQAHEADIWENDEARWPHEKLLDFYAAYPQRP
jgi:hypothetical protein